MHGMRSRASATLSKLDRAKEGWLDGILSKVRYRQIQPDLTAKRQSIDEAINDIERQGSNR